MAKKARRGKEFNTEELSRRAVAQDRRRHISHLPASATADLTGIAQDAARHGVVIYPDGTHFTLTRKPSGTYLRSLVNGPEVVVSIPGGKEKTVMVVNELGKIRNLLPNHIAQYIAMTEIFGTVVWLLKENLE